MPIDPTTPGYDPEGKKKFYWYGWQPGETLPEGDNIYMGDPDLAMPGWAGEDYWTYVNGKMTFMADKVAKPETKKKSSSSSPSTSTLDALSDIFQPNKYPTSDSYSGLEPKWRKKLAAAAIPELIKNLSGLSSEVDKYESGSLSDLAKSFDTAKSEYQGNIENTRGEIDTLTKLASRAYRNQMQQGLSDMMPGVLNQLAGRNMLQSSVASDAISKAASEVVSLYSQKGYETAMAAAQAKYGLSKEEATQLLGLGVSRTGAEQQVRDKASGYRMQIPTILTAISALTQYSESHSENPLAPYELLANFIATY